ncbi:uncharacterized protein I206_102764 [Kwoniella pini CBS 10737]|uniref:REJ domain-containing protein n=1 Tax=Kwoniella pini CBS 10737 TaxID=1296096 RepID=A0AAJ8L1H5_9TREE
MSSSIARPTTSQPVVSIQPSASSGASESQAISLSQQLSSALSSAIASASASASRIQSSAVQSSIISSAIVSPSESASASASESESESASASASQSASVSPSASVTTSASASPSNVQSSIASQTPSPSTSAGGSSSTSEPGQSTSVVYVTVTDQNGSTHVASTGLSTGAASGSSKSGGSNTGAIVGGVIGGIAGLAILATLLWFFCFKKRRNNDKAFDEKTFDPARHSVNDPIDLISPSVPNVGGTGAAVGASATSPRVDPYTYASSGGDESYDPYAHAPPMQMPDARDYMQNSIGHGGYNPYGSGMEGGYGVAAAAGAGAGAAAGAYGSTSPQQQYSPSYENHYGQPQQTQNMSTAAMSKQREAAHERYQNRLSGGYGGPQAQASGSGGQSGVPLSPDPSDGGRRESANGSVYQHTDMGSLPNEGDEQEEIAEIPPK